METARQPGCGRKAGMFCMMLRLAGEPPGQGVRSRVRVERLGLGGWDQGKG